MPRDAPLVPSPLEHPRHGARRLRAMLRRRPRTCKSAPASAASASARRGARGRRARGRAGRHPARMPRGSAAAASGSVGQAGARIDRGAFKIPARPSPPPAGRARAPARGRPQSAAVARPARRRVAPRSRSCAHVAPGPSEPRCQRAVAEPAGEERGGT